MDAKHEVLEERCKYVNLEGCTLKVYRYEVLEYAVSIGCEGMEVWSFGNVETTKACSGESMEVWNFGIS